MVKKLPALLTSAPIPWEAPVTMAVFRGPLMVLYLGNVRSPQQLHSPRGSEVRVQHDAIAGLA